MLFRKQSFSSIQQLSERKNPNQTQNQFFHSRQLSLMKNTDIFNTINILNTKCSLPIPTQFLIFLNHLQTMSISASKFHKKHCTIISTFRLFCFFRPPGTLLIFPNLLQKEMLLLRWIQRGNVTTVFSTRQPKCFVSVTDD